MHASRLAVVPANLIDVILGLRVWGDPAVLGDRAFTRIVGRKDEAFVGKQALQVLQVADATFDVLLGVESVLDAILAGGGGDELHEPFGAFGGDGVRVVVAFGADDRVDEERVEPVEFGFLVDDLADALGGRGHFGEGAHGCDESGGGDAAGLDGLGFEDLGLADRGNDGEGGTGGGGEGEGGTEEAAGLWVEPDDRLYSGVWREVAGPGGEGEAGEDGEASQGDSYQWIIEGIIAGWYDF